MQPPSAAGLATLEFYISNAELKAAFTFKS
jgi:hypothetical protein